MMAPTLQRKYKLRPRVRNRVRRQKFSPVRFTCTFKRRSVQKKKRTKVKPSKQNILPKGVSLFDKEDIKCAICLDTQGPQNTYALPCEHKFHRGCLSMWFLDNFSCPVCRDELNEAEFMDFVKEKIRFMYKLFIPMQNSIKMNVCPCVVLI